MNRRIIYIILPLLALLTCFSAYRLFYHSGNGQVLHPSDTKVSAAMLTDAYDNAEGQADSLFLDKTISVNGILDRVHRNESGRYVATLKGRYPGKTAVDCILDSFYTGDQPEFRAGNKVSIRGKCAGRSMNVIMTQCIIEK